MPTPKLPEPILTELREAIHLRYGHALYHLYNRSRPRLFFVGLYRLLTGLVHWSNGMLHLRRPARGEDLALYNTGNQRLAVESLKRHGRPELAIYGLYNMSAILCLKMIALLALALPVFIVRFWFDRKYRSLHDRVLLSWRVAALKKAVDRCAPKTLTISNDHNGPIYWLGFIYSRLGLPVHYVQHGMVKPEFPTNQFAACYLRDLETLALYRDVLCKNPKVELTVLEELAHASDEEALGIPVGALIALSHQFHLLETRALVAMLRQKLPTGTVIRLRFHPSDRFAKLKLLLIRTGHAHVALDPAHVPFKLSFDRSVIMFCASSSILAEAASIAPERVVWIKGLGLKWDYYNLSSKIQIFDHSRDAAAFYGNEHPLPLGGLH